MSLLADKYTRAPWRVLISLSVASGLAGCAASATTLTATSQRQSTNGPAADYPVVIGIPYAVGAVEYTPANALNYDEVGYAALDNGTLGYTAAHHTLPLPSYVEVTALESGRTALVRVERRGPLDSQHLLALSPAALVQLGIAAEAPVRVRRVNPPEVERFELRAGNAAPLRLETPASLLTVLRRKLPARRVPQVSSVEIVALEASDAEVTESPQPEPVVSMESEPVARIETVVPNETEGRFYVQAAAFANEANAQRAADALGGKVSVSGRFHRVRTGPFATRGEAEASLANVRRAGYDDARILTID
ncbi:SPOR domain-containing protein [Aurantiacibacter aquimixticola]|uniref:Sporulation protein SsgA n=1 Tax=Aurantiacibacter aquimixticola TaxID=1958945 RepID=A0A419RRN3_9SPHN|nr:SPOR domain-containing protein [Aurantiacibacter aquimixticola]RJY08463.1 sporulation protein SsgA [Aurantiacibacter aquimixticola]